MNKQSGAEALKLENQVCFPLYACAKEVVRQYRPYLEELELTYTQYIAMLVLWERGSVDSRALSRCLHLDFGTLTPVLKRLEALGYLTRARSAEDERVLILTLRDKGRALRDKAARIPPAMADCLGLTDAEFITLYALLYKSLGIMEGRRSKNEA